MLTSNRKKKYILIFLILALLTIIISPMIGMKLILPNNLWLNSNGNIEASIFWDIRVPRVLAAFLIGASLALSGMAFQAIFRNPLATPFTLGVSSGASFGATLALHFGLTFSLLGINSISLFAFLGAVLSILIVYALANFSRNFSAPMMLLAGVAVNFFFSSFILFLQYLSDFTQSFRIVRWLMGEFRTVNYSDIIDLLPFVVIGSLIIFLLTDDLNLLSVGEDFAISRGVQVGKSKKFIFFSVSLMVGSIVALCGPIGFVGLMIPHICRLLMGANHRNLAPATLLFGGTFLVLCDTIARTLIAPADIPVGIITALLGGPFFLWLLLKSRSTFDFY